MKALTLYQPWASLIAVGAKTIETRSWTTKYRGPLAIHAAKDERPCRTFAAQSMTHGRLSDEQWQAIPFGAVVATCELVDVVPTHQCSLPSYFELGYGDLPSKGWDRAIPEWDDGDDTVLMTEANRDCGDFTHGRFAWLLDDVKPLQRPLPAKGHQQLWEWSEFDYKAAGEA